MQIIIAAVGRMKRGPAAEMIADYLKRIRWDVSVKELPDGSTAKEAEAILALVGKDTRLIAMDSRGTPMTSEQFAASIQKFKSQGVKKLVIAIGGQDGLHETVIKEANATLAFGSVTWPHQLLRLMLTEQLYRAYSIETGHPYHLGH